VARELQYQHEARSVSRYCTLVLVSSDADIPEEEACVAAAELLYPYMYNPDEPTRVHNFDYMYSPEDIADLTEDGITDHAWPVSEILEPQTFTRLQVEAIVTPGWGLARTRRSGPAVERPGMVGEGPPAARRTSGVPCPEACAPHLKAAKLRSHLTVSSG
jgi:hypothetical protein